MPIEATVVLDSGCFLPVVRVKAGYYSEVGYFQNLGDTPDIKVFVDGNEVALENPLKLGNQNGTIEVRHAKSDGSIKRDGATCAPTFHKQILHMMDLYGEHIQMERTKFDCVLRFESGRFLPSMVKRRAFKESKRERLGSFTATGNRKEILEVSHNVIVHFTLKRGETLQLARDGEVFLSSANLGVKKRIEIELPVDNLVGNKFYHDAFKTPRPDDVYWLPNDCDPPPTCPEPPCNDEPPVEG